ncbi:hypothetical protein D3Y55_09090 [Mesorhizobium sp. DCY119]|nr:hypothetical protein D3Y55_09090 [Mesorhizobium sp. DCY119]
MGALLSGESMAELVLRATVLNSYRRTTHVLAAAGFEVGRHSVRISSLSRGLDGLAVALGLPHGSDDLERVAIRPIAGKPGWVNFFRAPLRAVHRDARQRRVSPMSLRKSLHLKAMWTVGVFSFDPDTKELLLDRCPECLRPPTFSRSYGLQFCVRVDRYGVTRGRVDFRDYPQPNLEINDLEALDFCSGLIDPERSNGDGCRSLHPEIGAFEPSALFEGILAVACAITSRASHTSSTLERPSCLADYQRFTSEVLAKSARMFLDWPDGFHKIAADVRATAGDRSGYYGVRKELGPIVAISMDQHVDPLLKSLLKRRIATDMEGWEGAAHAIRTGTYRAGDDYVPVCQATKDFNLDSRTILRLVRSGALPFRQLKNAQKGPMMVDVAALKDIIAHRRETLSSTKVAVDFCVPRACVSALADMGLLTPAKPRLSVPYAMGYYEKSSVEDLRRRCEDMASRTPPPATAMTITKAVGRLLPKLTNPWPEIFLRIIAGQLEVWCVGGKSLMASLAVRDAAALQFLYDAVSSSLAPDIVFTQQDAAGVLKTTPVIVNQLVREGFLSRKPTVTELGAFEREFILTSEITERFSALGQKLRWRDVPRILRAAGIQPYVLEQKKTLVWQRREVEPLLAAA